MFTLKRATHKITSSSIVAGIVVASIALAKVVKNDAVIDEGINAPQIIDEETVQEDITQSNFADGEIDFERLGRAELIQLLGHEEFRVRDKAHKLIWKLGRSIYSDLEANAESSDPEIATRISDLIRNIKIGVTFDTPKHIADKIAEFQMALLDKQEDILYFLFEEKAYNQMVYMLSEMKNREDALKLHKRFKDVGHFAARHAIIKDDVNQAIELLKMSPQTDNTRRSLAFLYAQSGGADEEYQQLEKRMNQGKGVDEEWMLMLLQEMDNRDKLRDFAHQVGNEDTVALLDLLNGQPETILNRINKIYGEPNRAEQKATFAIKKLYTGEVLAADATEYKELFKIAKSESLLNKFGALNLLFLSGAKELGEQLLVDLSPVVAHNYFDERERPKDAIEILGLNDEASLLKWRDNLVSEIILLREKPDRNENKQHSPDSIDPEIYLLRIANFFYRRGQVKKSKVIIDPYVWFLKHQDPEQWVAFLASLPGEGMRSLFMDYVREQAEDEQIQELVDILYDETELNSLIWKNLLARDGVTILSCFEDMCVIKGMFRNKHTQRDILEKNLIRNAQKMGKDAHHKMILALYQSAEARDDSVAMSNYLKIILANEEDELLVRSYTKDLIKATAAQLDWEALIKLFEKYPEFANSSSTWLTIQHLAYKKLGKNSLAEQKLQKALLMSLGMKSELDDIIDELVLANEYQSAIPLVEKMLLRSEGKLQSDHFFDPAEKLAGNHSYYLIEKDWKKAAAMSYVYNIVFSNLMQDRWNDRSVYQYHLRLNSTLCFTRGMDFYQQGEHQKAKNLLSNANSLILGDGLLADHFYPSVRNTGYDNEYESWVNGSHQHLKKAIIEFPESANLRNTLAWISSRSVRFLDEGVEHAQKALALSPNEPPYLDTMGELWFAKGDRTKAIEWGNKAVESSKRGRLVGRWSSYNTKVRSMSLNGQLDRFKSAPLPQADVKAAP